MTRNRRRLYFEKSLLIDFFVHDDERYQLIFSIVNLLNLVSDE